MALGQPIAHIAFEGRPYRYHSAGIEHLAFEVDRADEVDDTPRPSSARPVRARAGSFSEGWIH